MGKSNKSDFSINEADYIIRETVLQVKGAVDQLALGILDNMSDNEQTAFISKLQKDANSIYQILHQNIVEKVRTELEELYAELDSAQREVIYRLTEAVELRSKETGNHVKRVSEYCRLIATDYGLSQEEVEILTFASPMHDIGKVIIPDSILHKPGRLTTEEFDIIKTHASAGYDILKTSNRGLLKAASVVAHEHHEKFEGGGYPRGIKGEEIHIYGRIAAVADVFDALSAERAYKKAWEIEEIVSYFGEGKGKQFDPDLIDIFMNNIENFSQIRNAYKD